MTDPNHSRLRTLFSAVLSLPFLYGSLMGAETASPESSPFEAIGSQYESEILPLLESHCLKCHDENNAKGDLDLERMESLEVVRQDPRIWQKVLFMVDNDEMPPKKSKQLSAEQTEVLLSWIRKYLDAEAHDKAGDPGRVVVRRLTNTEFDRTVHDLTGIDFRPTREFPVDNAAGEGFTNNGESMVMSPGLFDKYLEVAKEIAAHAVLLPDGFRFSKDTGRGDWTEEPLDKIRVIYDTETVEYDFREKWSRVDLVRYCKALIQHHERLRSDGQQLETAVDAVAAEEGLNRYYLRHLARLAGDGQESGLLNELRVRLRDASSLSNAEEIQKEAVAIAAWINGWQDRLWRIDPVGQLFNQGQQPQSPLVVSQELRLKLEAAKGSDVVKVSLVAHALGDGNEDNSVLWKNARLEGPTKESAPLPLSDVREYANRIYSFQEQTLAQTKDYLAVLTEERIKNDPSPSAELAAKHQLDAEILDAWTDYLKMDDGPRASDLFREKVTSVNGLDFLKAWGRGTPSVLASSSMTETVDIPGRTLPRTVGVHPSPDRHVAVGWSSPISGDVRIEAAVTKVHNGGNGVTWTLIAQQGGRGRSLASGVIGPQGSVQTPSLDLSVRAGHFLALAIGPRDRDHACDQTRVNILVTEKSDQLRSWNLAADVSPNILAGNPHADSYGNEKVWYFYQAEESSLFGPDAEESPVPEGSALALWRTAVLAGQAEQAKELAEQATTILTREPDESTSEPDRSLYHHARARDSRLFKRFDHATLVKRNDPVQDTSRGTAFGIDPASLVGEGSSAGLLLQAPNAIRVAIPANLAAGRTLVVTGELAPSAKGAVQLEVVAGEKSASRELKLGSPVMAQEDSPARQGFEKSFSDFRVLFPRILCCRSVVPAHKVNVITLQKLHREDEHLKRLLMGDTERARLDKLWDEVYYISQDAIETLEYYPLFVEFSTQGTDTHEFLPLEPGIRKRAGELTQWLKDTEPVHLDALIDFATRAFRRPLSEPEEWLLRAMYAELRAEEEDHDAAFRGVLARIFVSPSFLYRIEEPLPGTEDGAVTSWELATRLSYFLWSTMPDKSLLVSAAEADLTTPDTLVAEAKRMLNDDRVHGLATEFACQWLHVRDFNTYDDKNERQYPGFAELRDDMYEETIRFFEDLFRRDGSVLEILDADHTFLNEALARHYGIEGVTGEEWRRVDHMKQQSRGGVLGMATVLSKQSGATRTSPVLRGNWVVETLLGEKLPDPPATVPELPDALSREGLTVREMTEKHVSDESCANCHVRIDPFGFALEAFDAIGRYRLEDLIGKPVNTQAQLRDGREFSGIDGLRTYLLTERRDDFLEQFCRKLLGFAIGRSVELSDQPLVDEMVKQLIEKNFRFSAAVETIVRSKQFLYHRGLEATHEESI